ncbi:5'-3' exoribonuclease 2 [Striga asiatica]|uniref:5'-3' exoribonuclease n=1 Tax=Striga asiatica TaxID=4170 RepID=A0A5A7PUI4_STRAF|nr:5'-3' exoribonuclease 2 [Striga asiatica]
MGVPSFYRWLVEKYPKIVCDAGESSSSQMAPKPNAMEFDNFYLDMNGIIHPCFHPQDNLFGPTTFEQVFGNIYEYIDRLFNIVRPRKLLFLAIDGVAPRAKMNQQRARRFKTSKDIQLAEEMEDKLRKQFEREGKSVIPKEESQVADSNVITPGTEFMHMLSNKLQSYISLRMSKDSSWANIKVILSDDSVPGEGEHKIMSFILAQRSSPGYDPNTRHCLYGQDADLIMLGLATHEIHFSILREEVLSSENQLRTVTTLESSIGRADIGPKNSRGWFKEHLWQKSCSEPIIELKNLDLSKKVPWKIQKKIPYQFLNLWVLREYLELDLRISEVDNFVYDIERVIDDFIFICFFAGNDFLPHIPSLEIHEGCMDLLMHVYKKEIHNLGGYLVDMQKVDNKKGRYVKFKRVERFILMVGAYEEKIFSKRYQIKERKLRRILAEFRDAKECEKKDIDEGRVSDIVYSYGAHEELKVSVSSVDFETVLSNTKELKQKLKDYLRNQSDLFKDGGVGTDKVKFGTPGWKERYYKEKFSAETTQEIELIRRNVAAKYGEGLCWVLLYYFCGVPSWTWFYPYHYGPLASDLKGLSQTNVRFQKGLPFKPFDQLMAVLPPKSVHALPSAYKGLMTDENSNIIDFYPSEFETDLDGKRFAWQGICKLPFIEEERLLRETRKLENDLKEDENIRNLQSLDRLFVRRSSEDIRLILHGGIRVASDKIKDAVMMDFANNEGINGIVHVKSEDLIGADDDTSNVDQSKNNLCVFYEVDQAVRHIPRPLENVNIPEKIVYEEDITETTLWHESTYNNRLQNRRPVVNNEPKSSLGSQNFHVPTGRGFSVGRGRAYAESRNYLNSGPVGQMGSGSGSGSGFVGSVHQPCVGKYGLDGRSKPTGFGPNPIRSESGLGSACEDWRVKRTFGGNPGANWQQRSGPVPNRNTNTGGLWSSGRGSVSEDWRVKGDPGTSWQQRRGPGPGLGLGPNNTSAGRGGRGGRGCFSARN